MLRGESVSSPPVALRHGPRKIPCMVAQVLPLAPRVSVDEVSFDNVTMKEAVRRIVRMAKKHDRARYVCTGNLDHLVLAERDSEFREAYRHADLVVADGAPVVWLSRLASPA